MTNPVIDVIPADAQEPVRPVSGAFKVGNFGQGKSDHRVSSNWASRPADQRFLSLAELETVTREAWELSDEMRIDSSKLRVHAESEADRLAISDDKDTERMGVSHWTFGQLCALGDPTAPASYLRKLPPHLAGINLQWSLAHRGDEVKMLSTHWRGEERQELRAVTGPDYGRIPDFEVVRAVQKIAGNGTGDTNWKIPGVLDWGTMKYNPFVEPTTQSTTLFASDRDVFMFLCDDTHPIEIGRLPSGDPDLVFRGFYAWNSEVGARSMGVATFYLRALCCNRILWGVEGYDEITLRHTKNAPDAFAREVGPALLQFSQRSDRVLLNGITAAKEAVVAANDEERRVFLLEKAKCSKGEVEKIIKAVVDEEGHAPTSIWDFVQGMTAVARANPHTDARLDLEKRAGKLLDKVKIAA